MYILLFSGLNFLIASFLITSGVASSEIKYKVSEIPKDLLKDSKAVIRNSEVEFIISDIGKAVKKVNYAITILNENGINNSVFFQFYDKFSTIRKVQAKLYNQNGEPIRNGPNIRSQRLFRNCGIFTL